MRSTSSSGVDAEGRHHMRVDACLLCRKARGFGRGTDVDDPYPARREKRRDERGGIVL